VLIADDGTESRKWLELNENIAVQVQVSSASSHMVARRRSTSFINILHAGARHSKLS